MADNTLYSQRFTKDRWDNRKQTVLDLLSDKFQKATPKAYSRYMRDPQGSLSELEYHVQAAATSRDPKLQKLTQVRDMAKALQIMGNIDYPGEGTKEFIPQKLQSISKDFQKNKFLKAAIERSRVQEAVASKESGYDLETFFPESYEAARADAGKFTKMVAGLKDVNPARIVPPVLNKLFTDIEGDISQQLKLTYKEKPTSSVILEEALDPFDMVAGRIAKALKGVGAQKVGRAGKRLIEKIVHSPKLNEVWDKTTSVPSDKATEVYDKLLGKVSELMQSPTARKAEENLEKILPERAQTIVRRAFTKGDIDEYKRLKESLPELRREVGIGGQSYKSTLQRMQDIRKSINLSFVDHWAKNVVPQIPSTAKNFLFDLTNVNEESLSSGDKGDLAIAHTLAFLLEGLGGGALDYSIAGVTGGRMNEIQKKLVRESTDTESRKFGKLVKEISDTGVDIGDITNPGLADIEKLVSVIQEQGIEKTSNSLDEFLEGTNISSRDLIENIEKKLGEVKAVSSTEKRQLSEVSKEFRSIISNMSKAPGKEIPVSQISSQFRKGSGRFVQSSLSPKGGESYTELASQKLKSVLGMESTRKSNIGLTTVTGAKVPSQKEITESWRQFADSYMIGPEARVKGSLTFKDGSRLDIPQPSKNFDGDWRNSNRWEEFTRELKSKVEGTGEVPDLRFTEGSTISHKGVRDIIKEAGKGARMHMDPKSGLGFTPEQWRKGWKAVRGELTTGLPPESKAQAEQLMESIHKDYERLGLVTTKLSGDKDLKGQSAQSLLDNILTSRTKPTEKQVFIQIWRDTQDRAKELLDQKYDDELKKATTGKEKFRIARARKAAKKSMEVYEGRVINSVLSKMDDPVYSTTFKEAIAEILQSDKTVSERAVDYGLRSFIRGSASANTEMFKEDFGISRNPESNRDPGLRSVLDIYREYNQGGEGKFPKPIE